MITSHVYLHVLVLEEPGWINIIIAANGCCPGWYQGAHIQFDSNYYLNSASEGCLFSVYNTYGITYQKVCVKQEDIKKVTLMAWKP